MEYGLAIFLTDESIGPAALARAAEERGFGSLFVTEHTHIPTARTTPWGRRGEGLPRHYYRILDPFIALTAAAMVTERLRLGTGVSLLIQRDPIVTAKEVATLDWLSGGRVELGVGAGWNREEIENHGTPFDQRFGVLRERVEAMREIWTQEAATYHGKHVHFDAIASWPKPVQQPGPPVLIGGGGERVLKRVVRYGDAWIPNDEENVGERIARLQQMASQAGRGAIPVTYFGAPSDEGAIDRMTTAGVDRVLFDLPSAPASEVEPELDRLAALVARHG
jgi:probable F420-dependent oxidoreductase